MPNEVDDFLNGVNGAPQDPFKPTTEDPFKKEGEVVEGEKKEEVVDEKPLPFHKDPKVQRYIEKEVEKLTKHIKPTEAERFVEETRGGDNEADEILTRIIGNDTPEKVSAIKDFKKYLGGLEEKGAQKALAQLQEREQKEKEEEAEAQEQLVQGFEEVEEKFGVDITSSTPIARKTRGEFIDFIKRIAPKNEVGEVTEYPDIPEAFTLFQEMSKSKPQTSSRAKDLSSRSMTRSGSSEGATEAPRANNWREVDKIFSKLGN